MNAGKMMQCMNMASQMGTSAMMVSNFISSHPQAATMSQVSGDDISDRESIISDNR